MEPRPSTDVVVRLGSARPDAHRAADASAGNRHRSREKSKPALGSTACGCDEGQRDHRRAETEPEFYAFRYRRVTPGEQPRESVQLLGECYAAL